MLRLVRTIAALVGVMAITVFALANRAPVAVDLLLTPGKIEVPLYALFLSGLIVGCALGAVGTWLSGLPLRREARRIRRRLAELESRERLRAEGETGGGAAPPALARAARA
ncbi:MAG: lipopolysaccharide assembly protein LapA domain-containing protein [Geminicoccaceae bacterium]|nr:lipopolysaccharide assembly protein LapA domain-containing protein [Geminicoccaceae bacterium]MCS7269361.1 lipopolysaccharide assembly protein LapA domain-containing protein [Geminicoccaceae bacterium]MCX7629849.1 lipopolysaccharide assembly protein LapA domain-containing protein [Geminicoccaceae bacterium]MDW8126068.1 lipopolysaccharide assembly protein LapA domain-containing protein [Geminicoccaceae bacterium]MDW8340880.1 lipopolysaccharide assembly protein LapA domain-containing protein [